jgi:hypothetical protein
MGQHSVSAADFPTRPKHRQGGDAAADGDLRAPFAENRSRSPVPANTSRDRSARLADLPDIWVETPVRADGGLVHDGLIASRPA